MSADWPDDLETDPLTRAEWLLVWAMRAIAMGHEDCPTVARAFRHACGARGGEVLQTYVIFVKYLAMAAPRRLQVHVPSCPCVGADEAGALAVIAAGQRSPLEAGRLRETIRDVVGDRADDTLFAIAQRSAALFASCDLVLPARAPARGGSPSPALH